MNDFAKRLGLITLAAVLLVSGAWGQIAAWNFYGYSSITTHAAYNFDSNMDASNLITRGENASASAGNNSFRTTGFKNDGIFTSNTDYFQITLSASEGYTLSLSTIDAKFAGTATFYASPGVTSQFAYSLDGTNFTLIGSPVTSTTLTLSQIDLSGVSALQNVDAATTVTLRYYASGQTTTGGWGFISSSVASSNDGLSIGGSVDLAPGANEPPAITNIVQDPASNITSSTTVSVSADVTDDNSVTLVQLKWGTSSESYPNTIAMNVGSGDTYTTDSDIPAQSDGTTVYYVIYAEDDEEASRTSAEQSYTVWDPKTTTLPYAETFDSDLGDCYVYNASGETKYWVQTGGYAYMSGYNTGDLEEDWLILPGINLDNYSDEVMTFDTWWQYGTDNEDNYLKLLYSTNYTGIGDPSLATWTELAYNQPGSATTWATSGAVDLSGISGTSVWIAFKYNYNAGMYRNWRVDNISIEEVAGPMLAASTETLSGFTYREGDGPSAEQSFTVSGINLEGNISITPPTNYEISTGTGASFVATNPVILSPEGGTVNETTIYVRLKAGLSWNSYMGENISISSTNAESKSVTCGGKVTPALPFAENFDYPENDLLVDHGWIAHSGTGTNSIRVVSPGLEFSGYPGSGIGNAAALDNNGEDVNLVFDAVASGTVYVSFLMKTSASNSAGYFLHLGQTTMGTTFFSKVWVNATGDGVGIGSNAPSEYIPITPGTPTLIVLKLNYTTKLSELFVFNSMPSSEPATPDASFTETASFTNVGSVALRQYNASQNIIVDGIRVATSWNDAPLPICLASFSAEAANGKVNVTWVTESETENAAFRIYRDGEMIAELEGAGTTSEPQSYSYTDQYVIPGRTYSYVLADVDYQGKETKHPRVEVEVKAEGIAQDYNIGAAYPNPFNPLTIVPLNLAKDALVTATLYDITGRPLRELQNGSLSAGSHALKIDGSALSTGIYFVHINVNNATHVQKIALMK